MKLASFDIFDTTLLRLYGRPESINVLLAGKEHTQGDALEQQVERENLIANPVIRDIIRKKRQEGWQIAFISDMYLSSAFLMEILQREGCYEPGDKVYISCEHNARKDTGTLYDLVRRELHPDVWEHYGDNQQSDVRMAEHKGIQAHWVNTRFNDAEQSLLVGNENLRSGSTLGILAGVSRAARICLGNDAITALAANVVAMTYIPFALWVLNMAKQNGIKRLYFLSRDTYVIMKAAAVFADDYDIELKYLYVSRRSLYLPFVAGGTEADYLEAADKHTIIRRDSVDKLLLHLGTSRKELKQGYNIEFAYHRTDTEAQQRDFLDKIFHSAFTTELQIRANKAREEVLAYFRQEGLMDGVKSAMVDVGWLGTTRLMINKLLSSEGVESVPFLYFGVRRDAVPFIHGAFDSFFRVGRLNTSAPALIEHYLSASPYPTTIGYQQNADGLWNPIFPIGETIKETEVVRKNCQVIIWIAEKLKQMAITDEPAQYLCAKNAIEAISERNIRIDLSPLSLMGNFDQWKFIKRFTLPELFAVLFIGKRVTEFDWGSLKLTIPMWLCPVCWQMHEATGKIRGIIFRKIVAKS